MEFLEAEEIKINVAEPAAVAAQEPAAVAAQEPAAVAVQEPAAVAVQEPAAVAVQEPANNLLYVYEITIEMIVWLSETTGTAIDRCYRWLKLRERDPQFLYAFLIAAHNQNEEWIKTTDFDAYVSALERELNMPFRFNALSDIVDIHTAKNKLVALKTNSLRLRDKRFRKTIHKTVAMTMTNEVDHIGNREIDNVANLLQLLPAVRDIHILQIPHI